MIPVAISVFVLGVVVGLPIAFVLGFTTLIPLLGREQLLIMIPQRLITGIDSFPLMAIPFFMLAGEVMTAAGITERVARFSLALLGYIRGGLAHMNILAGMIMAGISGSGVADAAALGPIEIRIMSEGGYPVPFSAAVTAAANVVGPIIPPSIMMVIYAVVEPSVSIAGLFISGILPGILLGLSLMIVCYFTARKRDYPVRSGKFSLREFWESFLKAIPALIMPVLIIGGIVSGVFTPTEASAVATVYALVVGFFVLKTLHLADIPRLLLKSGVTSSIVLLIIGMASGLSWFMATLQIPQHIVKAFHFVGSGPAAYLLCVNVLLLFVGCVMDITAGMIIFVPILAPVATQMGIDPIHFAMVVVFNLCIGMITPPVGNILFVMCSVAKISMEALVKEIWPLLLAEVSVLLLITYLPRTTLTLPRLFGF